MPEKIHRKVEYRIMYVPTVMYIMCVTLLTVHTTLRGDSGYLTP